jgi:hypothetical protein
VHANPQPYLISLDAPKSWLCLQHVSDHYDTDITSPVLGHAILIFLFAKHGVAQKKSLENIKKQGKVDFNRKHGFKVLIWAVRVAVRLVNAWQTL